MKKEDRRVRYTKMVLRENFLELLKDRPISKITVKDVCERADVNRGTFYAHYSDTVDLMEQIETDLIDTVQEALNRHDGRPDSTRAIITEILYCIAENEELCKLLLSGGQGFSTFILRVTNLAREQFERVWLQDFNGDADRIPYANTFIVNGSIGVMRQWIETGMREPCDAIAEVIESMVNRGMTAYL